MTNIQPYIFSASAGGRGETYDRAGSATANIGSFGAAPENNSMRAQVALIADLHQASCFADSNIHRYPTCETSYHTGGRALPLSALSHSMFIQPETERPLHPDTAEEFAGLDDEAEEEGYEPCAQTARDNADRILHVMNGAVPAYYAVSPTSERSVRITAKKKDGNLLIVLCKKNGGATCIAPGESMFKREDIKGGASFRKFAAHILAELGFTAHILTEFGSERPRAW